MTELDAEQATRSLGGQWKGDHGLALCPAHDDHNPSLQLKDGDNGKLLWHCHANCSQVAVARALNEKGVLPATSPSRQTEADIEYVYCDTDGSPLFKVVRRPDKRFYQMRWDEGQWRSGVKGIKQVPYLLDKWFASSQSLLFLVEGEKDADRLTALGYQATTNAGGAGKFKSELADYLQGFDVIILPDNDDAGRAHAQSVNRTLSGIAKSIRVHQISGLKEKGDISDWLDAGNDFEGLIQVILQTPASELASSHIAHNSHNQATSVAGFRSLGEILNTEFPPLNWFYNDLLPEGLTLIAGPPKIGKSFFCLQLAICWATNSHFLDFEPGQMGKILYLALEDSLRRIKDRAIAFSDAGLDLADAADRLLFDWEGPGEQGLESYLLNAIEQDPEIVIIVIDVIVKVRPVDQGRYQEDYRFLSRLQKIAIEHGVAIVAVHHTRKAEATDAMDRISGTQGLAAAADTIMVLSKGNDGDVVLNVRGREGEEQDVALGREGVCWVNQGAPLASATTPERTAMLRAVREQGEATIDQIAEATGCPSANVRQLLSKMVKKGEIDRVKTGVYSAPG